MIDTPEVPEQHRPESSRPLNRMATRGHRTDDGSPCLLRVTLEADGSWTIHGVGDTGIRLSGRRMVVLAQVILERAR